MSTPRKGSVSGWNPGSGKGKNQGSIDKLMSTEAKDHPDSINGTNELKAFSGKAKKPSGPFGIQGKEF